MYFIIEHQTRPDGIVNTSETARSTYSAAVSYYHERYSKMVLTDLYTSVSLMLVDADLKVIDSAIIATQYNG